MELRSAGIQRLLVVFVLCVCGYVLFYNSLFLDRRDARLPGRLLFQQVPNASLSLQPAAGEAGAAADASRPSAASGASASAVSQPAAGGTTRQAAGAAAGPTKPAAASSAPAKPTSSAVRTVGSLMPAGFLTANAASCPEQGAGLLLVILITSAPGHQRQRKAIRLTWGGAVAQQRRIRLRFFLGRTGAAAQRDIAAEQDTFGDIVQGNFVDAYGNLTLKSASMLEWLDAHCGRARLVLKTDDDMFIHPDNLLTFARLHANDTNRMFGRLARRWKPIRSAKSKYYLSPAAFPPKFLPDFMTGPAYVMTSDLVRPLLRATLAARFLPLEDVLVTGVVGDRVGVRRVHATEFINERVRVDTCKFATAISVHMVKFEEQFDIWKRLQDGRARCPRPYRPTAG